MIDFTKVVQSWIGKYKWTESIKVKLEFWNENWIHFIKGEQGNFKLNWSEFVKVKQDNHDWKLDPLYES